MRDERSGRCRGDDDRRRCADLKRSAAGPRTSNGSAPTIKSAVPSRNAAAAESISSNPVLIPCATRVPALPLNTKDGAVVTFR
jgi:hypothetical protein